MFLSLSPLFLFSCGMALDHPCFSYIWILLKTSRKKVFLFKLILSLFYRELSILLDCTDEAEVELYIAYVVSKAKWSPKYDIRVFSNEGQMKVKHSTGLIGYLLNAQFIPICHVKN